MDRDALCENGKRLELAIEGSGTGVWDRNVQSGEIYYSTGWKALFGYSDIEISTRIEDSYSRIHPDDLDYVKSAMQAHFEQKTDSYEVEHRIRCKDGSYKWICSRGKVCSRDADGRALRMLGTTTDITAIRAMSQQVQQMAALLTSLTNEIPGMVFQYRRTPKGKAYFSYVSAGVGDIFELTPEAIIADASATEKLIHPEDRAIFRASLTASASNLSNWHLAFRVRLPRQGMRWRQGDARPQRLEDGSTVWHGLITDITERKRIEAELHEFATMDFLTQLYNRRHFMQQIDEELLRLRHRGSGPVAVLMFDLDHFKSINDQWGHAVGDQALQHFSAILRSQLRKSDLAGRLGGEEFAVVLSGADSANAAAFAQRLQRRLAEAPMIQDDLRIVLTISVGIAEMHGSDVSAEAALARSDLALYSAKQNGRNRIERHCPTATSLPV